MSTEIELFKQQAYVMEKMDTKISKMEEQVNSMTVLVARIDERLKQVPSNSGKIDSMDKKIIDINKALAVTANTGKITNTIFGAIAGAATALIVGLLVRFLSGG